MQPATFAVPMTPGCEAADFAEAQPEEAADFVFEATEAAAAEVFEETAMVNLQ